jgi:hypothetical protein
MADELSIAGVDPPSPGPDQGEPGPLKITGVEPPKLTVASVNGKPVGERQGFWADFGQGTGGFKGLISAPFTSSIPAELVKGVAKDNPEAATSLNPFGPLSVTAGLVYKKIEDFLHSPDHRPLTERLQETFHELKETAKDRPGLLVGSLVHAAAADPELFFLPELGGARAATAATKAATTAGAGAGTAKVVGAVTGAAARAGGGAAIGGGAELASELGEDRPLDLGELGVSSLLGAAAGVGLQARLRTGAPTPKLTPAEIDAELAKAWSARRPKPEVTPVAGGYMVRFEGETAGKTFGTKAEAESAARELEAVGSAHESMGSVPRGTEGESKLLLENPFTAENMAKWVERPKAAVRDTARASLEFWGKTLFSAGVGAAIGATLDRDDRTMGATFGAAITLVPRALSKLSPAGKRLSIAEVINRRNGEIAVMARHTLQLKAAIDAAVPEPLRRSAISLALEKHEGVTLNPEEAKVAATVRGWFDRMGQAAVDAGVIKELLNDYITHIVEEDPTAKARDTISRLVDVIAGKARGVQPSGRQFAQHRQYATFDELQQALRGSGLRIKTGDVGEIVAIYSKAMFKAITDKRLVEALKVTPVEGMRPLVAPREVPTTPPTGPSGFRLPPGQPPGQAAKKFGERPPAMLLQPLDKIDPNFTILPNRQLAGYAVHKDIAPQLNFVFSARDPNDVTLGLMALNQASKRAVVSFSLFHAKSLTDAFIGAMGTKAFTKGSPLEQARLAVETFKRPGNNEGIDALLRGGMVLQQPEDTVHGALGHIAHIFDETLPVGSASTKAAEAISKFNTALDNFTFAHLQTGFKIITGLDAYERLLKKGLSKEVAGKLAASYANDIYGSLDWFRVANDVGSRIGRDAAYMFFNPNGRRVAQLLMFAPDWTVSTFRAAYKALPGAVDDPALAALHRRYLAKSAVYYLTIANGINLLTAGHSIFDNENPTRVQLKDGRTMQWSKHSMEPFEWLRDPLQTTANKLAFLPREAIQQLTGKEYVSVHDAAPDIDNRAKHLAEQFLPIMAQQGLGGGGATSALGLVGMPVYGRDPEQKREARLAKKKADLEKRKRAAEYYRRLNR